MDRFCESDLITAHGDDFGIFEMIDTEEAGYVMIDHWMSYLRLRHEEMGATIVPLAHAWLRLFLHTMQRNLAHHGQGKGEAIEFAPTGISEPVVQVVQVPTDDVIDRVVPSMQAIES